MSDTTIRSHAVTVAEAYEAWSVCFAQVGVARAAVDTWSVVAMRHMRRGAQHPSVGWTFDAQDDLEHAEAALSTAREEWDMAKQAERAKVSA